MLLLNKIQIRNFFSHLNTEIDFKADMKALINGESGAGKSSIVDAIIWCIYGKARTDNRSLVRRGATGAVVILTLTDSETHTSYRIERSTTVKGKNELNVSSAEEGKIFSPVGASGIRYLQEFIETKIVKASYLLFINSIAYPQDNLENFVKQTAEKRKDIILEIIRATDYDSYYEKAHEAYRAVNETVTARTTEIREKSTRLDVDKGYVAQLTALTKSLAGSTTKLNDVSNEITGLTEVLSKNKEVEEKISIAAGSVAEIERTITAKKAKIAQLTPTTTGPSEAEIIETTAKIAEIPSLRAKKATLDAQREALMVYTGKMSSLRSQAPAKRDYPSERALLNAKMIKLMTEHVPNCPELVDRPCSCLNGNREVRIKEFEEDLATLDKSALTYAEQVTAYDKMVADLGTAPADVSKEYHDVNATLAVYELLEKSHRAKTEQSPVNNLAQIAELQEEISAANLSLEQKREEINTLKLALVPGVSEKLSVLQNTKNTLATEIGQVKARIDYAKEAEMRVKLIEEEIAATQKLLVELELDKQGLEAVKAAFGSKGIKAIMVDYVIPQLEDRINDILHKLSDFTVRLETQRAGASEDVLLEGLFITIINAQGEAFDLANYSGGEKMKINTAISEGLASLQKTGFRIFDENIVGLDSNTIENFVEVLVAIQSRFNQLLCISHLQQIKDVFQEKLTVVKQNGTSSIV